jgi:hypothetical protein
MRFKAKRAFPAAQRGRAGPIMALVALVLVGALAKETLTQLGLVSAKPPAAPAVAPGERARAPGAIDTEAPDADAAAPAQATAIGKARGVQALITRQSEELAAKIETETR